MVRPRNDIFSMDFEDSGFTPDIEEATTQPAAPTQTSPQSPKTPTEIIQGLVSSGAFEQNPNQAVLIDGTYYQPVFNSSGSGENFQLGSLQNVNVYKESENKVGGDVNQYSPTGEYQQTTKQQEVASFAGGISDMLRDPMVGIALSTVLPGIGVAIGETLGVSNVAGTAIAKVAVSVAQGVPLDDAIKDAAISLIVQTGSVDAAKEIVSAGTDPKIANAISSVGGSIVQTAAKGGDASDILKNAVSAGGASALISIGASPSVAKAIGVIASGGDVQAALNTLASGIGESKDVRNVVANTFLPSEPDAAGEISSTSAPVTQTTETPVTPGGAVEIAADRPVTSASQPIVDTVRPSTQTAVAPSTPAAPGGGVEIVADRPVTSVDQPIIDLIARDTATATPSTQTAVADTPEKRARDALNMALNRLPVDLRYDVNGDGKITSADALLLARGAELLPEPTVQVTGQAESGAVADQPIIDLVKKDVAATPVTPPPAPPEPPAPPAAPEIKIQAKPELPSTDQPIIDLITPKNVEAGVPPSAPSAPPTEEVKVTGKAEEKPPIIDAVATPDVAVPSAPAQTPVVQRAESDVSVTAPRDLTPEELQILDLIRPDTSARLPEINVTTPRDESVNVTAKASEIPIIDTSTLPDAGTVTVSEPGTSKLDISANKENIPIIDTTVPEVKITEQRTPGMTVTAPRDVPIIDTTTPPVVPEEIVVTAPGTKGIEVVGKKEDVPIIDTVIPDLTAPILQPEEQPLEEEPVPEEPYKPQITIFGGVPPKRRTLPQTLQAPFYPSAGLTQALTAQRGAGEIEGDPSGKPRKNVWNEASLRLKDALGL